LRTGPLKVRCISVRFHRIYLNCINYNKLTLKKSFLKVRYIPVRFYRIYLNCIKYHKLTFKKNKICSDGHIEKYLRPRYPKILDSCLAWWIRYLLATPGVLSGPPPSSRGPPGRPRVPAYSYLNDNKQNSWSRDLGNLHVNNCYLLTVHQ